MPASQLQRLNIFNAANSGFIAANEDIFNGDPTTDVLSMEGAEEIVFVITKNAGATGTATITIESCDDVVPTTTTAVAFRLQVTTTANTIGAVTDVAAAGTDTTAGADQIYTVSIKASELSGTDKFVRMVMTEVVDSPVDGAVISIAAALRYEHDIPNSMIA